MDQDILDQAMKTCGVVPSPTFSQASEPNFEIYDPTDRMIMLPEDPISPISTHTTHSNTTTLSTQVPPTSIDISTNALPLEGIVSIQRVQDTDPVESYTSSTMPFHPPSLPSTRVSTDTSTQTPSTSFQDASKLTDSLDRIVQASMKGGKVQNLCPSSGWEVCPKPPHRSSAGHPIGISLSQPKHAAVGSVHRKGSVIV